jgi:hypothetical protein
MNSIDRAYVQGMAEAFQASGLSKSAAYDVAKSTTAMVKKASLFNFGNSPYDGGGISLSSILIPLLAASAAGYVGYQSGIGGKKDRSAFQNVKNYIGRTLSPLFRDNKPPAFFDYDSYK